ncbi:hypothetical protein [Pseudoalteromonas sp. S16_S37]|uniref:hypothetical protein n=1 Tax=Pseudoalteromonas sp. S16_S37 TaxID=2720228 RepID=UPI001680560E|nr:hypothetical protein [Pseudoalteromonas sp. S16_S37]MBD1584092.1 hypothetical protein [Pseudoalteromonas sp. S16_S37]
MLIEPIYGIPVRLIALDTSVDGAKMCQMGIRFSTEMLHETVKSKLAYLLKTLGKNDSDLIQDN